MNISWNSIWHRILPLLSVAVANALIIYGISAVLTYLRTGENRSSILHLAAEIEESYFPETYWDLSKGKGRFMEPHTLKEITKGYLSSWRVRNNCLRTNDPFGLKDFYTDSAQVKVKEVLALQKNGKVTIDQTSLVHYPELYYYSADGKLVAFTDYNVEVYQKIIQNKKSVLTQKIKRSYNVLMLLEDGFWRVRHMVETDTIKPRSTRDTIKTSWKVDSVKGVNYYPKDAPWAMFGTEFNSAILERDFEVIRNMGLNTVRIFVNYEEFGKNKVHKAKLRKLKKVLNLAHTSNLKVVITLFDFYGDYAIQDWTMTQRHAEKIVKGLKDHPALFGWDLKNEPDLDFESRGKNLVLAWLQEMNSRIKQWDPQHPTTIGWSSAQTATNLSDVVDYVSFHYYEDPKFFKERIQQLKLSIPNKSLLLQEYGFSSFYGIWDGFSGSENKQATYYQVMQQYLKDEQLPFLFWTLYDFDHVPNRVAGWQPWRKSKQGYFGCIDVHGNKKAAYHVLK